MRLEIALVTFAVTAAAVVSAATSTVVTISATATTSAGAAIKGASAAGARRALFARTSFVDGERPALEVLLMEHGDGFFSVGWRSHFDEGEATGTACGAVLHDINRKDRSSLGKVILEVVFGRGVGQ